MKVIVIFIMTFVASLAAAATLPQKMQVELIRNVRVNPTVDRTEEIVTKVRNYVTIACETVTAIRDAFSKKSNGQSPDRQDGVPDFADSAFCRVKRRKIDSLILVSTETLDELRIDSLLSLRDQVDLYLHEPNRVLRNQIQIALLDLTRRKDSVSFNSADSIGN